jgi:hypothetical protein
MDIPAAVEELIASLKRQITALRAEVGDLRRQLDRTVPTVPSRLRATD